MKKRFLTRWLSLILAVILALPAMSGGAYAASSGSYGDVPDGSWYEDAVDYLTQHGIMTGYADGNFGPADHLSRAQFVVILYRMAGSPQTAYRDVFSDVAADSWYAKEVVWASDAGIVNGMGDGRFAPMASTSRQDQVVMMYRYAACKGFDVTASSSLSGFQDAGGVANYALAAMQWAVASGLIQGSDGMLNPSAPIVRAEAAAISYRFVETVVPSISRQPDGTQRPNEPEEPDKPDDTQKPGTSQKPASPSYPVNPGIPSQPEQPTVNLTKYGLAEEIEHGSILHAFCWNFNTIKAMIPAIAAAGFSAVQTSPINEIRVGGNGDLTLGNWYYHYQPTNYTIGNYQLGTADEFKAMTAEAHKYGVKIIVDQVLNHLTSERDLVSEAITEAGWGDPGKFGEEGAAWHHKATGTYWSEEDRYEETQNDLSGLLEWNTQNPKVQTYMNEWLKTCVAAGADGFRYDAAKLIELPDDVSVKYPDIDFASNYWPVVLQNGAKFQYGEVLQEGEPNHSTNDVPNVTSGYNDQDSSRLATYQSQTFTAPDGTEKHMNTTLSFYGWRLRDAVSKGNLNASYVGDMLVPAGASADRTVTWVESHDSYCNDASYNELDDQQLIQAWAILSARKEGTPLFFSRPMNATANNHFGDNVLGPEGNHFFMDSQVAAVNFFRIDMDGLDEYLSNPTGSNSVVMIERGGKGAVIVNAANTDLVLNSAAVQSMADGVYTDQASGGTFTVQSGRISGTVKAGRVAVIYNPTVEGRLELPAEVSLSVSTSDFTTDTLEVSVLIRGVVDHATYQLGGAEPKPVSNGDVIVVGEGMEANDSVTLTVTGYDANNQAIAAATVSATYTKRLYLKDTIAYISDEDVQARNWGQARVYVWGAKENAGWPGHAAELQAEGEWAGYWKYVFPFEMESMAADSEFNVIFNNGNGGGANQFDAGVMHPHEQKVWTADRKWVNASEVDAGALYAAPGSSDFYASTQTIKLHASGVTNATCQIDTGVETSFKDGDTVTIGQGAERGAGITLTLKGTDEAGETLTKTYTYTKMFTDGAEVTNVLFIGNSYTFYNDGVWTHFQKLAAAAGYNVAVDSVTNGSHTLTKFNDPTDDFGKIVVEKLDGDVEYDYVFLQENSLTPLTNYSNFETAAEELAEKFRNKFTDVEIILYQTWGRESKSETLTEHNWSNATMTHDLEYAYGKAAAKINAEVSPVGTAFHDVYTNNGNKVDMYDADLTHPKLPGTYLAALIHFVAVFGEQEIEKAVSYTAGLSDETVAILTKAAKDAPANRVKPYLYFTPVETAAQAGSFDVTLHALNVDSASYQIGNGNSVSFNEVKKTTVNLTESEPVTVKITATVDGKDITEMITYKMPEVPSGQSIIYVDPAVRDWTDFYVYLYGSNDTNNGDWPGAHLTATADGYLVYTLPANLQGETMTVIFNNNNGTQVEEGWKIGPGEQKVWNAAGWVNYGE